MLDSLSNHVAIEAQPRPIRVHRLRRTRRVGRWLLLTGWIVLPLMPVLALALSKLLGVEF